MGKHIKFFFEQSWLLLVASVFFGICLAGLNAWWEPKIIANEIKKFNDLAGAMIADANDFTVAVEKEDLEIDIGKGKTVATEIKKAVDGDGNIVGWAFVCQGSGFADKIKLVVVVDKQFEELRGFGVLSSNETPGFGDKLKTEDFFRNQFIGAPAEDFTLSKVGDDKKIDSEIVAITGATVTSESVVKILNNFISQVKTRMKEKGLI